MTNLELITQNAQTLEDFLEAVQDDALEAPISYMSRGRKERCGRAALQRDRARGTLWEMVVFSRMSPRGVR